MNRKCWILPLSLLMLLACSDNKNEGNGNNQSELVFTASVTPYQEYNNGQLQEALVNWTFLEGDVISVWAVNDHQLPTGIGTPYRYDGNSFYAVNNPIYIDDQQHTYYAIMPRTMVSDGVVSFSISANQSTENNFWENDLCTAYTTTGGSRVRFNFYHRLCCVCVNFLGDDLSGHDLQVRLNGIKQNVMLSLDNDDCIAAGTTTIVQPMKQDEDFYAIVPPQSFVAGSSVVTVIMDNESIPIIFDESVRFESGMMHYLDITYTEDPDSGQRRFVAFAGQINPWE